MTSDNYLIIRTKSPHKFLGVFGAPVNVEFMIYTPVSRLANNSLARKMSWTSSNFQVREQLGGTSFPPATTTLVTRP